MPWPHLTAWLVTFLNARHITCISVWYLTRHNLSLSLSAVSESLQTFYFVADQKLAAFSSHNHGFLSPSLCPCSHFPLALPQLIPSRFFSCHARLCLILLFFSYQFLFSGCESLDGGCMTSCVCCGWPLLLFSRDSAVDTGWLIYNLPNSSCLLIFVSFCLWCPG